MDCAAGWLGGGIAIYRFVGPQERVTIVVGLIAGIVGFCYFVQQQKLAEAQLFKQLFTEFNERYDQMNGDLADIRDVSTPCTAAGKKTLIDYFNLCGEEFLFYSEGYIHPKVWRSWCRGILWYLAATHIRSVWDNEVQREQNTYYDLTIEELRKGAKL